MKLELDPPKLEKTGNPRKKLIPLSPARKNITFDRADEDKPLPAKTPAAELNLNQAVLELCGLYLQLGLTPMQAYRSALADFPEATITGGIGRTRLGL